MSNLMADECLLQKRKLRSGFHESTDQTIAIAANNAAVVIVAGCVQDSIEVAPWTFVNALQSVVLVVASLDWPYSANKSSLSSLAARLECRYALY